MRECAARARYGLLGIAAVVLIAGCGGGDSTASSSVATPSATTSAAAGTGRSTTATGTGASSRSHLRHHQAPGAPKVHGPKVGATQSVHAFGAFLHVTVTGVGAVSSRDASPPPGYRAVAVALRIADEAGATYDSTASGDVSVIVSAGAAAPLDIRAGSCETQLVDFESHLYSGDVRTGCVGFSVPRHARVLGVQFSPHARPHGSVSWRAGG